jgi:hypothetical protein
MRHSNGTFGKHWHHFQHLINYLQMNKTITKVMQWTSRHHQRQFLRATVHVGYGNGESVMYIQIKSRNFSQFKRLYGYSHQPDSYSRSSVRRKLCCCPITAPVLISFKGVLESELLSTHCHQCTGWSFIWWTLWCNDSYNLTLIFFMVTCKNIKADWLLYLTRPGQSYYISITTRIQLSIDELTLRIMSAR